LAALGVAYLMRMTLTDLSGIRRRRRSLTAPRRGAISALSLKADRVPDRRIEYLARALEAASRSLKLASTGEARFNHALSSGRLAQLFGGSGSWADYVATERDPGWKALAQRHLTARQGAEKPTWEVRRRQLRDRLHRRLDFVRESARLFPSEHLISWTRSC
jgi:hypothetical protein